MMRPCVSCLLCSAPEVDSCDKLLFTNNASQVLRQLEQELNVRILPGTEIMLDVGSHHFVKSSVTSDRVLVPQPSENEHDPLVSNNFILYSGKSSAWHHNEST